VLHPINSSISITRAAEAIQEKMKLYNAFADKSKLMALLSEIDVSLLKMASKILSCTER
jgi:hypothetical protein